VWYTRRQQPVRMGLWYTANGFGIALGGLLGFGIGNIKGALPSWKFEFLIIGALCCVWGVVMFIFLASISTSSRYENATANAWPVSELALSPVQT
jgi:MFS family permease